MTQSRAGALRLRSLACTACLLAASGALAAPSAKSSRANPWHAVRTPAKGEPRSIGGYSAGCLQGGRALPLDGDGYHVMHPQRRRNFGHPLLVSFVRELGKHVSAAGLGEILVGDLGQPRGGPQPDGHSSHQTGLDVDIWFWAPDGSQPPVMSDADRTKLQARSVVDGKTATLNDDWSPRMGEILELAANDARVERMFVHPVIKRALCAKVQGDRAWLGKLRPWYGHDDHFHVRLACPPDSPDCRPQAPPPAGDGCAELEWWFSPEAKHDRNQGLQKYRDKVASMPRMPEQCAALLETKPEPTAEARNTAAAKRND